MWPNGTADGVLKTAEAATLGEAVLMWEEM